MINGTDKSGAAYLSVPMCERSMGTEVTADFTLPDYQSEIRRILGVFPTVLPPAKYLSDSAVELSGTLDVQVLYIGGDGGTYSVPLSSDYNITVPLDKNGEDINGDGASLLCSVSAESVSTRVSAPRRLSIRTRLRPNVRVYGKISAECEENSGSGVCKKGQTAQTLSVESASSDIINISYIVPTLSEDTRVVWADANVCLTDVTPQKDSVACRGEVMMRLLCVAEDSGVYSTLEGSVPIEGEIEFEACSEMCSARASGCIAEMTVNVTDSGIECNAGVILEAVCMCNREVEYTADAYGTEYECKCATRTVSPRSMLFCDNVTFTLIERIPLAQTSVPDGAQIITVQGRAGMDRCEENGGKYSFFGNSAFSVIYQKDGEFGSTDVSIPIKYQTPTAVRGECICHDASVLITEPKVKIADGNLCIDAQMYMSADCLGKSSVELVEKITLGDTLEKRDSELTVCYPFADDTLWSVAKRYRVAPETVMGNPEADRYVIIE